MVAVTAIPYKRTFAAKGRALYAALTKGPESERLEALTPKVDKSQ